MEDQELEFENYHKKINDFKTELKELIDKYNFGKEGINNYNGIDEYCGTDYYYTISGYTW